MEFKYHIQYTYMYIMDNINVKWKKENGISENFPNFKNRIKYKIQCKIRDFHSNFSPPTETESTEFNTKSIITHEHILRFSIALHIRWGSRKSSEKILMKSSQISELDFSRMNVWKLRKLGNFPLSILLPKASRIDWVCCRFTER